MEHRQHRKDQVSSPFSASGIDPEERAEAWMRTTLRFETDEFGHAVRTDPIRVMVVMPVAHQIGGAERTLADLIRASRSADAQWLVAFLEPGPMVQDLRELGATTVALGAGRVRQAHRHATTALRLARLARSFGARLIVGWMPKAQLYAGPAALIARLPCIWYQVGVPGSGWGIDRLATLLPAAAVMTVSEAGRAAQARLWPSRPTHLVYPGVDAGRFASLPPPSVIRQELGLPAHGQIVGTVGRLQTWKGMHMLVDAMPEVLRRHPDAHCLIVGGAWHLEPDYADLLSRLIRERGLTGRVTMPGQRADVERWMQAMDVFVLPSSCEPFGLVVIEAMLLGKPVVATAAGGPAEIITDGVDGLLVTPGSTAALAAGIMRCLDDPVGMERLGGSALQRAQTFSTEAYAMRFLALARQVSRRHRRDHGALER